MRNTVLPHFVRGDGVGLIDPHGDLAEDLLDHLPPARADHLVYFNPADLGFPVGLNLLADVPKDDRYRAWVIRQVEDPFIRAFWAEEFASYDARFVREARVRFPSPAPTSAVPHRVKGPFPQSPMAAIGGETSCPWILRRFRTSGIGQRESLAAFGPQRCSCLGGGNAMASAAEGPDHGCPTGRYRAPSHEASPGFSPGCSTHTSWAEGPRFASA